MAAGFKHHFFSLVSPFERLLPTKWLMNRVKRPLIFPFYHTVSDQPLNHIRHLYPVKTTEEFIADIDFLLAHYQPVGVPEWLENLDNPDWPERSSFLLSFDDGLAEIKTVIAPILEDKSVPAVCFLNSAFVDNKDLFFRYKVSLLIDFFQQHPNHPAVKSRDYLLGLGYREVETIDQIAAAAQLDFHAFLTDRQPYLSSEDIRDLIGQGFCFGGHSIDHPEYRLIGVEEQVRQTQVSTDWVKRQFDLDYRVFAFPFTDYGVEDAFFETIQKAEMAAVSFGCAGLQPQTRPRHFQRIPFEAGKLSGASILKMEMLYFWLKSASSIQPVQ